MINGDADVLLEGASVFGDFILLAKGRQEGLEVLVAGVNDDAKVVHHESERNFSSLVAK
jgi:hypothetical protein